MIIEKKSLLTWTRNKKKQKLTSQIKYKGFNRVKMQLILKYLRLRTVHVIIFLSQLILLVIIW